MLLRFLACRSDLRDIECRLREQIFRRQQTFGQTMTVRIARQGFNFMAALFDAIAPEVVPHKLNRIASLRIDPGQCYAERGDYRVVAVDGRAAFQFHGLA